MSDFGFSLAQELITARTERFRQIAALSRSGTRGTDPLHRFKRHAVQGFTQNPLAVHLENCYGAIQLRDGGASVSQGTQLYGALLGSKGSYYPKRLEDAIFADEIGQIREDIVGRQVLDIASGDAVTTELIFNLAGGLPSRYVAVDIVGDYSAHAARKFRKAGCKATAAVTEDIMRDSFQDHPFWDDKLETQKPLTALINGGWVWNLSKEMRIKFWEVLYERFLPGDCAYIFADNTATKNGETAQTVKEAYSDPHFAPWMTNGLAFSCYALDLEGLQREYIQYLPRVEETKDGLVACMDLQNFGLQELRFEYRAARGLPRRALEKAPVLLYPGEIITGGRAYKLTEETLYEECTQRGWGLKQLSYSRKKHPEFVERNIKGSVWRLEKS